MGTLFLVIVDPKSVLQYIIGKIEFLLHEQWITLNEFRILLQDFAEALNYIVKLKVIWFILSLQIKQIFIITHACAFAASYVLNATTSDSAECRY